MQCRRCGKELGNSMRCSFCGYENSEGNVREMTRTEKNFFNGVTIDADATNSKGSYSEENFGRRRNYDGGTRRTYINYGGSNIFSQIVGSFLRGLMNGNLLAKIAAVLIGIAFTALMFFVAIPILFVLLAIGIALLVLVKILK